MMDYQSKVDLLKKAKSANGQTFGSLDQKGRLDSPTTKGQFGHIIEESLFEYAINSSKEADFEALNVELKVTPFKKLKNGQYSAKERLVLNIINYLKEHHLSFYESSFWQKNQSLLLMFYEYIDDIPLEQLKIMDSILYEYPEADLKIIKNDWRLIVQKIEAGLAHEISEADTMYLAACTKGASSLSTRPQPFSSIPAKQRAYSFKTSYMTQLLNDYVLGVKTSEKIIKNPNELENRTFDQIVIDKFKPFLGRSKEELKTLLKVDSTAKSDNALIVAKILEISDIQSADEFVKANIKTKTIKQSYKGPIKESMSFPTFKFEEIIKEEWETSTLRDTFAMAKFLFVVFTEKADQALILSKVLFWNMPESILDSEVKAVWEDTVSKIKAGRVFKELNDRNQRLTHFMGIKDNPVSHVRPHATNALDTYPLPFKDVTSGATEYTKQCFWLNASYIRKVIDSNT